jgi:hypothetical protein
MLFLNLYESRLQYKSSKIVKQKYGTGKISINFFSLLRRQNLSSSYLTSPTAPFSETPSHHVQSGGEEEGEKKEEREGKRKKGETECGMRERREERA